MQEHEDLARYERLIFKMSRTTLRRLQIIGARSVSFEDVTQELRIGWLAASRSYNPEMGVPWMPYLINGLRQHAKSVIRRYTFKLEGERYADSIWEQLDTETGDGLTRESMIAGPTVDPVDEIARKEIMSRAKRRLSVRAGQFLQLLADTPPEISEQVLRLRDKAEFGRKMGLRTGANMTVTASMIFDLMDAGRPERMAIIREIKALGEKMCPKT